jgi:hypothetical protein
MLAFWKYVHRCTNKERTRIIIGYPSAVCSMHSETDYGQMSISGLFYRLTRSKKIFKPAVPDFATSPF